ncbi:MULTISPECIES: TetR-like C-terminal domain-containing protein [unclassified Sphingomonas]|uniref:TetR-like C-terminal domain-containing protein n=1 Tax=unclassified Sphingomonas TaxID=196159 RepID=UPI0008336DE1|nr:MULTISPECIES: TetR-like C-terminal domain-containing protein [unclassified Sphingomonas]
MASASGALDIRRPPALCSARRSRGRAARSRPGRRPARVRDLWLIVHGAVTLSITGQLPMPSDAAIIDAMLRTGVARLVGLD